MATNPPDDPIILVKLGHGSAANRHAEEMPAKSAFVPSLWKPTGEHKNGLIIVK
jgi:hypothetical protein